MPTFVLHADVLLPLALPQRYTYAVPVELVDFIQLGHRVVVQFGRNKYYAGIVAALHHKRPPVEPKLIETLADEEPIVLTWQLDFWQWIANYYLSTEGEVVNLALPVGLKLNSETRIVLNENYEGEYESLSADAFLIVQMLRTQDFVNITQIQSVIKRKNVYPYLKELFNAGIAFGEEKVSSRYKIKKTTYVMLHQRLENEEQLKEVFEELGRAPKQLQLLMSFLSLQKKNTHIRKKELLSSVSADAGLFSRLVEKNVFTPYEAEVSRLGTFIKLDTANIQLTEAQQIAFDQLKKVHVENKAALLYGVTGSGKTEIYTQLIQEQITQGKQSLFLLPEIALTAQIINRLKSHFGEKLGVYHSKFNEHEKVEIWNKVLNGEYQIIVAARSGIFLPFQNLGLIVVDEEHDASYKQSDPPPRYHARDLAIKLATMHKAAVVLGSATPSLESFFNAQTGKYGLVTLTARFGNAQLPAIAIHKMQKIIPRTAYSDLFSALLIEEIENQLAQKKQVILFHNRRGFSSYQVCRTCAHVYKCKNCDVSLTYHKFQNRLICHYCGYQEKIINHCVSCGVADLDIVGTGTEKIEELVSALFPKARVSRLDVDAAKGKHAHENIIADFENKEVDILVGTQMVSKGLDFENVNLVGVLQADMLLFMGGYRAHERAFQLLTQVSGRAGRKDKNGKVIIQTQQPQDAILEAVVANDFLSVYTTEINNRKEFRYPPFCRMIEVKFADKNALAADKAALYFANTIRASNLSEVLGPTAPYVGRVNNFYIRVVLLKTSSYTTNPVYLKQAIREIRNELSQLKELKTVRVSIDVDPI